MAMSTGHRRRHRHRIRRGLRRLRRWAGYVVYDLRMSRRRHAQGHSLL